MRLVCHAEEIDEGFPPIRLPAFQLQQGNTTLTFGESLSELSSALFTAPLIVLLEFVSVAKAFCRYQAGGSIIK
jgi:hypothetical protein